MTPNPNSHKLKTLGNRNILGVSKVSQPPESKFSIIKIEFLIFVVKVGITDTLCFDSHAGITDPLCFDSHYLGSGFLLGTFYTFLGLPLMLIFQLEALNLDD